MKGKSQNQLLITHPLAKTAIHKYGKSVVLIGSIQGGNARKNSQRDSYKHRLMFGRACRDTRTQYSHSSVCHTHSSVGHTHSSVGYTHSSKRSLMCCCKSKYCPVVAKLFIKWKCKDSKERRPSDLRSDTIACLDLDYSIFNKWYIGLYALFFWYN